MKRAALFSLSGVLLLAFGLRVIAIETRALWYDEAFAVLFSEKGVSAMLYGTLTPVNGSAADVHPLLYYALLGGWMHFAGESPLAVRLLSVLFSLITLCILYALVRDVFDQQTAIAALLITTIAPFAVQYAQEARMYSLLGLLLTLATWCYVRGSRGISAKRAGVGWWIGFAVCAGLSMYTQQLAAFYLIAIGTAALLSRRRALIIRVSMAAGGALLIYLPWLLQLPSQLGKLRAYWIDKPGLAQLLLTARSFAFVEMDVSSAFALIVSLLAVVLISTFLIYRAVPILRRPNRDRDGLALLLWLSAVPIGAMWLVSQWQPMYLNRALFPSALMAYAAVGWLFTRARLPAVIRGVLLIAGAASVISGLFAFYSWNTFPRAPFDRADAYVDQYSIDGIGAQIIHANKITALSMIYYDRQLPQHYVRDTPGSGTDTLALPTQQVLGLPADVCISAAANGAARLWYVIFDRQPISDLPWLDAHYQRESVMSFNDLLIYGFDQPDALAKAATCSQ